MAAIFLVRGKEVAAEEIKGDGGRDLTGAYPVDDARHCREEGITAVGGDGFFEEGRS